MGIESGGIPSEGVEHARVSRPDKPDVTSGISFLRTGTELGRGSEGVVERVLVTPDDAPGVTIPMAHKTFFDHTVVDIDQLKANYAEVRKSGLPTPHTVRFRDDGHETFMTDLTGGGKNVVISPLDISPGKLADEYRRNPDVLEAFAAGEPVNSSETLEKAEEYAQKADEADLLLTADSWVTVIRDDGTHDVVAADFTNAISVRGNRLPIEDYVRKHNLQVLTEISKMNARAQEYAKRSIKPEGKSE